MKKIITIIISVLMVFSSACVDKRSQEEKNLEEAQKRLAQAQENSRKAKEDYDNLVNTLDEYEKLKEELN